MGAEGSCSGTWGVVTTGIWGPGPASHPGLPTLLGEEKWAGQKPQVGHTHPQDVISLEGMELWCAATGRP